MSKCRSLGLPPFTLLLQMCDELEMKRVWHFIIIFLWLLFYTERNEREEKMCIFFRGDKIAWWTGEAEFMNMYSKCMSNEHHVMWWQNVIATAKFKYKSWRQLPNQTKLLEGCFPHHCYFRLVNLDFPTKIQSKTILPSWRELNFNILLRQDTKF